MGAIYKPANAVGINRVLYIHFLHNENDGLSCAVQKIEVMLNLIIQASIPEISQWASVNVACRQHLAMQKADFALFVQHRHTFMVWCKNGPQIEPGERLVNENKEQRLPDS